MPQSATGPSFMVSPKNGSSASQAISKFEPSLRLTIALAMRPPSPSSAATWPSTKSILPSPTSAIILLTLSGAARKLAAPVQQRQVAGERREVERPVERGIAAADDEDALVAERLHLPHRIEYRGALVGLDAGDRRTLGLERAAARRDHDDLDLEHLAAVGGHAEHGIADLLDRLDHLLQMKGRAERLDLRHQRVAEALAGDVGNARNVVDRLLRIELGALAADLVEDVDDMRLHVEQAELEHREQPARSRADDQHVGLDRFGHVDRSGQACSGWTSRRALRHASSARTIPLFATRYSPGYACRSGVRTTRPSSSAVTLIWQDSREFGCTS